MIFGAFQRHIWAMHTGYTCSKCTVLYGFHRYSNIVPSGTKGSKRCMYCTVAH